MISRPSTARWSLTIAGSYSRIGYSARSRWSIGRHPTESRGESFS